MVEEKTSKKKQLILAGVGLAFLLVLVIGATYAYFTFTSQNDFKDPATIEGSMGELGAGVTLTKAEDSTLTLNLSAADMLVENAQTYYASGGETPKTIATVKVAGGGRYNCTYTLEVTKTATSTETDMYERFQSAEYTNKSEGQIYFTVNDTTYDFNKADLFDANGKLTYNGTLEFVSNTEDINLTANMVISNSSSIDQTYLNGTDVSLSINATEFNCTLIDENATPTISSFELYGANQNSLAILVNTNDVYGIESIHYSINGGEFKSATNATLGWVFGLGNLEENTEYEISAYAVNKIGNQSEVITQKFHTPEYLTDVCSGSTLADCLLNNNATGLRKEYSVEGDDLYRYIGIDSGIYNYLCLGAETCTTSSDNMYRIIGVNPETKEIKVFKMKSIDQYMWHNNTADGVTWEESDLYNTLNTTWLNSISYGDLIVEHTWDIGDVKYINETEGDHINKLSVLTAEKSLQSTKPAKVGTISLTDHYLSNVKDVNLRVNYGKNTYFISWLNSISGGTFGMTRTDSTRSWMLGLSNGVANPLPKNQTSLNIYPTFFLTPNLQYVSGEGTADSPFIVELSS